MSLQSIQARGRAAAEARMTSRCTIRRKTGNKVIDAENQEVPEWVVVHADLPCRLATSRGAIKSRTQTPGEAEVERAAPELHVPALTSDLANNDVAEITAGENTGEVARLLGASGTDQATARRIPVVAVERPSEWSA